MRLARPPVPWADWVRPPLTSCPSPKPARFDKLSLRTNATATSRLWGVSPPAHPPILLQLDEIGPRLWFGPHSGLSARERAARRTAKRAWHRCERGQQKSTLCVRFGKDVCDTLWTWPEPSLPTVLTYSLTHCLPWITLLFPTITRNHKPWKRRLDWASSRR